MFLKKSFILIPITFLIVLLWNVLLRWPFLHDPLIQDPALFAYVLRKMESGAVLYRDLFDHKAPMIFLIGSLLNGLFKEASVSFFWMEVSANFFIAVLLFWRLRQWVDVLWACFFVLVATLLLQVSFLGSLSFAYTEYLSTLFVAGAYVAFFASPFRGRVFLMAVAASLAVLSQQVAALHLLPLFWWMGISTQANGPQRFRFFGYVFGIATVVTLILWHHGLLADFWYANVTYNLHYIGAENASVPWRRLINLYPLLIVPVLVFLFLRSRHPRRNSSEGILLLLWLGTTLVTCFLAKNRFYPHYFVNIVPPSILLAAFLLGVLHERWLRRFVAAFPIVLGLYFCFMNPTPFIKIWQRTQSDHRDYGDYTQLSAFLKKHWDLQGRPVFINTPGTTAFFLLEDLKAETPAPLTFKQSIYELPHPRRDEFKDRFYKNLQAAPPVLIISETSEESSLPREYSQWISANYSFRLYHQWKIYERRGAEVVWEEAP